MSLKGLIFLLFILAVFVLLFLASLHSDSYVDTGSCNFKTEEIFFNIKIYEKEKETVLSKYLKNSKLNATSSWQYYFRQRSFLESFENSIKNTGKMEFYFLFKSELDMSSWLEVYDVDVYNPKHIDYQLVHNKVVAFLKIFRAGDQVGLEKFMETLRE